MASDQSIDGLVFGELEVVCAEVEQAAKAFIAAADVGLDLVARARAGHVEAFAALEETFLAIIEACAFQDLTAQRLSRLTTSAGLVAQRAADPRQQGPVDPGARLDRTTADAVLGKA